MLTELGDHVKIECNKTGFFADIEFKTKGFFTGSYNCLSGKIKKNVNGKETTLYTLSGKWTDIIYLTDCVTGLKEEFLNIQDLMSAQTFTKSHGTSFEGPNEDSHAQSSRQALHKKVPPMSAQSFYESRQLWLDVTQSLEKKDYEAATTYKSMIEEDQRLRKVNSPIFMEKEDFDQLVSFDGIDPTPIIKPDSLSSDNITAEKIYYKVLVDPHSEVPLMTRYFQSNDGIHWRFKYFLPPSIIPESVSMSSPSLISFGGLFKTPSILSSKDSRNADSITSTNSIPGVTLPHSSYSERELTELLQRLFCSDARDDYMDRTYYLSVK